MAENIPGQAAPSAHSEAIFYSAESSPLTAKPQPDTDLTDIETFLKQNGSLSLGQSSTDPVGLDASSSSYVLGSSSTTVGGTTRSLTSVPSLHHECQRRGFNPEFDIHIEPGTERGPQRFLGSVKIGDRTLVIEQSQPSKKDVKALLADMALPLVKQLQIAGTEKPKNSAAQAGIEITKDEDDSVNWIGKLLEYNNSLPVAKRHISYTDYPSPTPHRTFTMTVTVAVPSIPDPTNTITPTYVPRTFGSPTQPFSSKRGAKIACSRLAMQALITSGTLAQDGSVIPKPKQTAPQPAAAPPDSELYAAKIPAMCYELGLQPPTYSIAPTTTTAGNGNGNDATAVPVPGSCFFDCSASFGITAGLPEPAAQVRNVYGRKNAKEECARALAGVLERVKTLKMEKLGLTGAGNAGAAASGSPASAMHPKSEDGANGSNGTAVESRGQSPVLGRGIGAAVERAEGGCRYWR